MSEDQPRPGSFSSLDRRVEKLENRMDSVMSDLADLKAEVRIGNAAMSAVSANIQTLSAEVKVLSASSQLVAAETKASESRQISTARMVGMIAAGATAATSIVTIAMALRGML